MEEVFQWATGTIEGIAFVEYLIILVLFFMWREIREVKRRIYQHEKEFHEREKDAAQWRGGVDSKLDSLLKE